MTPVGQVQPETFQQDEAADSTPQRNQTSDRSKHLVMLQSAPRPPTPVFGGNNEKAAGRILELKAGYMDALANRTN